MDVHEKRFWLNSHDVVTAHHDNRTRFHSSWKLARPNILALQHLDPIDVTLGHARAPGQGRTGDHSVAVAVDARGEATEV
ncbi:hypothetical protein ACIOMQ_32565 [Streptomyces sp. NPDC087845]|uniref:hypothetical protein n=1 Tax=Streptomyces sp. NPDC087845 TaxID=3365806 RepID=UPI00382D2FC7